MKSLASRITKYKSAYWRRIYRGTETNHSFKNSRKHYKYHIKRIRKYKEKIKKSKTKKDRQYWIKKFNQEVENRRIYEGYIPSPQTDYFSGES